MERIPPPILPYLKEEFEIKTEPVTRGLKVPVLELPSPRLNYPTIDVPFEPSVKPETTNQKETKKEEKTEDTKQPVFPSFPNNLPQINKPNTNIPQTTTESITPKDPYILTVAGVEVTLPDPSLVASAGAVAVVTTAATMVSSIVFTNIKNAAEPMVRELSKNKFKIKLKHVKPVLHVVMGEHGAVEIIQYSKEGVKQIEEHVENIEQYLRDQVDRDALYEYDNKILIDDNIMNKFTKEGAKRFGNYKISASKMAKKLSSRISF